MYVQFVELVLFLVFEDVCVVDGHPVVIVVDEGGVLDFEVIEVLVIVDTLVALQVIVIFKLIIR